MCGMACSDEDCGRSRRPDAEEWRWSSTGQVLGGRVIERSDGVVYGLHHAVICIIADESCYFS
jgi:hypothetical protein